jgi:glucose-6-phosphate 1-dehydrogenase
MNDTAHFNSEIGIENDICELAPTAPVVPPTTIVIFGATGDLTHRKIFPALYNLSHNKLLPESCDIVAVGRRPLSVEAFRAGLSEALQKFSREKNIDIANAASLLERTEYLEGDITKPDVYAALKSSLATRGDRNIVYYLATEAAQFTDVLHGLGKAGLGSSSHVTPNSPSRRIVIEKPFGKNTATATELNTVAQSYFLETDIFRIDHYLGKETVQNLLYLRFANSIFEPLWNRGFVDNVQITVAESLGVGTRGGYYDKSGATRDMIQNHLLQLFALLAMEPPSTLAAESIRDEKIKVLRSVSEIPKTKIASRTVRAQYEGYTSEPKVAPESQTETFVALQLEIDNWRWAGVPFYLRTGKSLRKQLGEIVITFKRPPGVLFAGHCGEKLRPNQLTIRVQPNEGIVLQFNAKRPGQSSVQRVDMDFCYSASGWGSIPEAYERLLLDVLVGDSTLFTRWDEVLASWKIVENILSAWQTSPDSATIHTYKPGSDGPEAANKLLSANGHAWKKLHAV